jgi:hypothetical protein
VSRVTTRGNTGKRPTKAARRRRARLYNVKYGKPVPDKMKESEAFSQLKVDWL